VVPVLLVEELLLMPPLAPAEPVEPLAPALPAASVAPVVPPVEPVVPEAPMPVVPPVVPPEPVVPPVPLLAVELSVLPPVVPLVLPVPLVPPAVVLGLVVEEEEDEVSAASRLPQAASDRDRAATRASAALRARGVAFIRTLLERVLVVGWDFMGQPVLPAQTLDSGLLRRVGSYCRTL
jgi:hypothetical protein